MLHQFDPATVSEARQRAILMEQQVHYNNSNWNSYNSRQQTEAKEASPDTGRVTCSTTRQQVV